MAIPIEGFTVVAQRQRIQHLLDREAISFPNSTHLADDHLWRCSFMAADDAAQYLQKLQSLGLNTSVGPDSDVVLVNEGDGSVEPYCEWLLTARWEKAVIAWLAGTEPRSIVARPGWDPKVGSGLTFVSGDTERLELLRVDDNVEVYRDKDSGKELYAGRTTTPVDSLYKSAAQIIGTHWRNEGEPPLTGANAARVRQAIEMLDRVLAEVSTEWRVYWFYGRAHLALGDLSAADASFRRAYELEKNQVVVNRELTGTSLELGKFSQAVEAAERAVTLEPASHTLIGNLALAYLLAGRIDAAQKSIHAASRINASDPINRRVKDVIEDVATGRRPPPKSMADLQHPPKPQRRKFWQIWR